ncbi:hypothetical protein Fmac_027347 [Flemingia macrophylla]|uniref:Uncharacterized protein n=1 Tax=Flemingia macrophylla TaxID=520843 RepID=A0ABD1LHZ4_9FABA
MYNVVCTLQLRQSLINEGNEAGGTFFNCGADNDDNEYDSGNHDFDMPDYMNMEEEIPPCSKEVRRGDQ